jgi:hypothetical protein
LLFTPCLGKNRKADAWIADPLHVFDGYQLRCDLSVVRGANP